MTSRILFILIALVVLSLVVIYGTCRLNGLRRGNCYTMSAGGQNPREGGRSESADKIGGG
jgi:hypothetical protein